MCFSSHTTSLPDHWSSTMRKHHRSYIHICTEVITTLTSHSPLLPDTFCVHIHMRANRKWIWKRTLEYGYGRGRWQLSLDSLFRSSDVRLLSESFFWVGSSVEQNGLTKRPESEWIILSGSRVSDSAMTHRIIKVTNKIYFKYVYDFTLRVLSTHT